METSNIKIHVEYQRLTVGSGVRRYASDTINYILAEFDLGDEWQEFDAVQAIWKSKYDTIRVLLDTEGHCMVPQEVLSRESKVQVNLVGFTSDGETLTSRLTSYPVIVLDVDAKAELDGSRSEEITPTQFERFVSQVSEASRSANDAADRAQTSESAAAESEISALNSMTSASDSELSAAESADRAEAAKAFLESASAEATTLTPGSQATASYSEGVFRFGIPQGDVNIEQLRALLPTETVSGEVVSITDGQSVVPADSLEVSLSPIQDLHGYDAPWVGGAGKNLIDSRLSVVQAVNTSGTWNNNAYTLNGLTFTVADDGHITINGTSTANTYFTVYRNSEGITLPTGSYVLHKSGSADIIVATPKSGAFWTSATINDSVVSLTESARVSYYVQIKNGKTISNYNLYPMFEEGSTASDWSPYSNICPISGRTEVVTQRTGKNLIDASMAEIGTAWNGSSNSARARLVIPLKPNTDYVLSMNGTMGVDGVFRTFSNVIPSPTQPTNVNFPWTFNSGDNTYLTLGFNKSAIAQINIDTLNLMLELGTTATAYEPYEGDTYTTALGRTVYGGTLDVVSGELVVTDAIIASYNGETLPSTWISDRDEYASGTTPTTGAQVVYELANPQTIQLTPQEVQLLLGTNNVWSDGDVTLVYNADIQRYIEKKLNA